MFPIDFNNQIITLFIKHLMSVHRLLLSNQLEVQSLSTLYPHRMERCVSVNTVSTQIIPIFSLENDSSL